MVLHLLLSLDFGTESKGQVNDINYSVFNEVKYINQLFGLVL